VQSSSGVSSSLLSSFRYRLLHQRPVRLQDRHPDHLVRRPLHPRVGRLGRPQVRRLEERRRSEHRRQVHHLDRRELRRRDRRRWL